MLRASSRSLDWESYLQGMHVHGFVLDGRNISGQITRGASVVLPKCWVTGTTIKLAHLPVSR